MNLNAEVTVQTVSNLADKTMFLTLEFNRFGNSRQADVEVANTTADQTRFTHSKKLLNSPELKAIQKADNALRNYIDMQPTVWKYGKSMRVVGFEGVDHIDEVCENYQTITRPGLVTKFVDVYLERIAEAQKQLGDKFNAQDYPTLAQVKEEFAFTYQLVSFSTPEGLKASHPKLYAKEKEKATKMYSLAVEDWKNGRRAILQEMVNHLLSILTPEEGKKKKLHATAVTKLQTFLDTFDLGSVPDDDGVKGDVAKLKMLMQGVDADKIKESDNLKAELVAGFTAANANLSTLVTSTGRKFR